MTKKVSRKGKKHCPWTENDEQRLIENVRNNVTNLTKAFNATSKEIQRSPTACAAHWYARTSIKSGICLFMTVSGKHIAINRKNGKGEACSMSLFQKVLAIFGLKS